MAEESLKKKTIKGTFWSGIDNVAQIGVSFVVSIVLARLLTPDDYGLLGIILIFTSIFTSLINAGFTTALIRKIDTTEDDYNTSFYVNLGLSLFFYIVIFLISPLISDFFGREELTNLTRVVSIGLVIGSLSIIQQARLTKRIDFKSQTKATLAGSVLSGCIGITMALMGYGVWSLVAQILIAQTIKSFLLCVYDKWTPQIKFSKESFHELFGFGWKMMVSALLDSTWKQLYQVVVGRFYNPSTLGQYTRSTHFSQLFSSNLTGVIQRVTYPTLSNIQSDRDKMVSAYRKIIKVTMFVTAISMFALGAVAEPFLYCLIGPKWHEAAVYLPMICLAESTYPIQAVNLNMLQVLGRSDLFLYLEIAKKFLALGPLLIGAFVGIIPMLYANLLFTIIAYFLNSHYSGKFLGYSYIMQLHDISKSYLIAFLLALSVYFLKFLPLSYWIILPIQIIVGVVSFFILCFFLKPTEYEELKSILIPFIKSKISKNE